MEFGLRAGRTASVADGTELPLPEDVDRLDADPVRAFDATGSAP